VQVDHGTEFGLTVRATTSRLSASEALGPIPAQRSSAPSLTVRRGLSTCTDSAIQHTCAETSARFNAILGTMRRTEERYLVNDVEVLLVRDETGARWECSHCRNQCEHILQAVAWMTLQSWAGNKRADLH
jgi:hypothetical protein